MKNDMRLTIPLWQMGMIVLMIIATITLGSVQYYSTIEEDGFLFEWQLVSPFSVVLFATVIIFVIYLLVFWLRIRKHNQLHPTKKINPYSFKPQEYISDDELFDDMTRRATQKVYSYYTIVLPLFVGMCLGGGVNRIFILVGILLIAGGQYLIYYRTMKKMLKGSLGE